MEGGMLFEVLKEIRDFFPVTEKAKSGTFEITGGTLALDFLPEQFYIIEGSVFNDGLHRMGDALKNERFTGFITPLAVPQPLIELSVEIEAWQRENATASQFESESFGGYTYKRATGRSGGAMTWKDAFAGRLAVWRKL